MQNGCVTSHIMQLQKAILTNGSPDSLATASHSWGKIRSFSNRKKSSQGWNREDSKAHCSVDNLFVDLYHKHYTFSFRFQFLIALSVEIQPMKHQLPHLYRKGPLMWIWHYFISSPNYPIQYKTMNKVQMNFGITIILISNN